MHAQRAIGIVEVLLSGVGFGFIGVFGKAAFAAGLTPGENLALRFVTATILLAMFVLARQPSLLKLPPRVIWTCAGLGLAGYAVFSSCYFQALKLLSASLTVLLLYTYPVFVALGERVFLGRRLTVRELWCLPLSVAGMTMLVWGDAGLGGGNAIGVGFGLASAVLYAAYILVSRRHLAGVSPLASVTYIQGFAGLGLAAIFLHDGARVAEIAGQAATLAPIILGMAVICTVLPMTLMLSGLQKLNPSELSLLSTMEPITGVAMAAIFLGERLSLTQMGGGAIIIGVMLVIAAKPSSSAQRRISPT
jgi:drug/metabolite transporter (DMT)-like permease